MRKLFAFDNTYARLPSCFYARQSPVAVAEPVLVKLNQALTVALGLCGSDRGKFRLAEIQIVDVI